MVYKEGSEKDKSKAAPKVSNRRSVMNECRAEISFPTVDEK